MNTSQIGLTADQISRNWLWDEIYFRRLIETTFT